MRANSKLHEDLVYECSNHASAPEAISLLLNAIADRLEAAKLNPVKVSDLISILREDTSKLSSTLLRTRPMLRG